MTWSQNPFDSTVSLLCATFVRKTSFWFPHPSWVNLRKSQIHRSPVLSLVQIVRRIWWLWPCAFTFITVVFRKMQIKTAWGHYPLSSVTKMWRTEKTKCQPPCGSILSHCRWGRRLVQPWKRASSVSYPHNMRGLWPNLSSLGKHPTEIHQSINQKSYTRMPMQHDLYGPVI